MIENLENLIEPVRALAIQAGVEILRIYRTDFAVVEKADKTLLTQADTAANEIIVNGLANITPNIPVIAEESPESDQRLQWPTVWMVDPLDGTREFVNRSGEFSVNIALIDQHEPVLGLVYVPIHNLIYWGTTGGGAFKQHKKSAPTPIHSRKPSANPPRVLYGRSTGSPALCTYLNNLGTHEARKLGSAFKSCQIAEGLADLYPRFGPTSEWDTAASQIILSEAGGTTTDMQGQALRYNARATLDNPEFLACGDPQADWTRHAQDTTRS